MGERRTRSNATTPHTNIRCSLFSLRNGGIREGVSLSLVSTKIFRRGFRRGSDYRYHFRAIEGVTRRGMLLDVGRVFKVE